MPQTCCCGVLTVSQGTLIIAFLDVVGALLTVARNILVAIAMIFHPEIILRDQFPKFDEYRALYITMSLFAIIMGLGYFAVSALLLQGWRTKNHRLCMFWLYWNYVALTLLCIFFVLAFILLAIIGQILYGLIVITLAALGVLLAVYFINVVRRYVEELKGN